MAEVHTLFNFLR